MRGSVIELGWLLSGFGGTLGCGYVSPVNTVYTRVPLDSTLLQRVVVHAMCSDVCSKLFSQMGPRRRVDPAFARRLSVRRACRRVRSISSIVSEFSDFLRNCSAVRGNTEQN